MLVRLQGGLGNQLFQYALGFHISTLKSIPLFFDQSAYFGQAPIPGETPRSFELARLVNDRQLFEDAQAIRQNWALANSRLQRVLRVLGWTKGVTLLTDRNIAGSRLNSISGKILLKGYFQSESYFTSSSQDLRKRIREVLPKKSIERFEAERPVVAVHVRLGDYIANPVAAAYHATCGPAYYRTAMELMRSRLDRPLFMVYSDDLPAARALFQSAEDVVFSNAEDTDDPWNDLSRMANADHHIIANSSYSWWAAWLGVKRDQQVVAPATWYKSEPTPSNLLPQNWIRL